MVVLESQLLFCITHFKTKPEFSSGEGTPRGLVTSSTTEDCKAQASARKNPAGFPKTIDESQGYWGQINKVQNLSCLAVQPYFDEQFTCN